MKKLVFVIFASLLLSTINSCDIINGGDDDKPNNKFLVSYELVKSYLPDFIGMVFNQFVDDYPTLQAIADKADRGILVYRVSYNTLFENELVQASGLVCVPTGEGPFPIISFQNGTNTLHSNAPSVNPDNELFLLIEFIASTGFVVVIPDYLGFGESSDMFHPYLHRKSTVRSVLDMNRAAREFINNHLKLGLTNELYLTGYSQGGWATMHVHKEIEEKFSDEFILRASACAAGPYNLKAVSDYILEQTNYPQPYFLAYLAHSYNKLGLTTPIDEIFAETYANKIENLFDGTLSGAEINAELTTKVSDLLTDEFYTSSSTKEIYQGLFQMMEENSITGWETEIPTLIIHGMEDKFVPRQVGSTTFQSFEAAGSRVGVVKWLPLAGLNHQSAIIPAELASINWFLELHDSQ